MQIALVDDRETDRRHMQQLLQRYDAIHGLEIQVKHFSSGEALLQEYRPLTYSVIFLDIYMPGIDGIETARAIRAMDNETALVFMTESELHYADAYSVFAAAYLTKTCSDDEFFRALDHVLHRRTEAEKRFSFAFNRRSYSIRFADLVSVETDGNYILLTDRDGKQYRTRMTFSAAEQQLDERFLTVIKGVTLNMEYITRIQDGLCILRSGKRYPLQIRNQKALRELWLNFKFNRIRRDEDLGDTVVEVGSNA